MCDEWLSVALSSFVIFLKRGTSLGWIISGCWVILPQETLGWTGLTCLPSTGRCVLNGMFDDCCGCRRSPGSVWWTEVVSEDERFDVSDDAEDKMEGVAVESWCALIHTLLFHAGMLSPAHMTLGSQSPSRRGSLLCSEVLNPQALLPRWCGTPRTAVRVEQNQRGGWQSSFSWFKSFLSPDSAKHAD